MSRARTVKAVAALTLIGSLIFVAVASAAAWLGPWTISTAPAGDQAHPPTISMGTSGDVGAGWWDPNNIIVARKLAGQSWSAPLAIGNPVVPSTPVYQGVDGAGDVTTAWTGAGGMTIVSDWPAGAPTAHSGFIGTFAVNDLAVNPAGVVVVAGVTAAGDLVAGYRPAGGAFSFKTFVHPGVTYAKPRVAINAAGMAVVIFRDSGTGLWASTRTATTDWSAAPELVNANVTDQATAQPSVAIDGAGNVFAAFTYAPPSGSDTVRTSLRPPSGGWQESPDLSSSTAAFHSTFVTVVVNPSGTALLVWEQTGATASDANIQARYGSTGTGIWGPIEIVNDAGADVPVAAIGNDGTGVAAWERNAGATNRIGQARVRSPGAAGAWGDIHNLSSVHPNFTQPAIATDGLGDFGIISAPDQGSGQLAIVSAYDAAPPALSPASVSGTHLAGDPVTFAVSATDTVSSVGTPTWTFGDGTTGTGLSVAHTYAAAGSYTAHVSVSDGSGNSTGEDVAVTVGNAQATLSSARFAVKWNRSRVKGTLTVSGAAPRAGTYAIDVSLGKSRKLHSSFTLPAGAFSRRLTLPAKFLPGTYHIVLTPADTQVTAASVDAKLAAPASGVVDTAFMSGQRNGTSARTLTGTKTIWASFHFAARAKGKLTMTWYKLGKKRVRLGSTTKDPSTKVVSYIRSGVDFKGTYQAVLSRKGVVVAQVSVKTK
jgi:hypothetical protein